MGKKISLGTAIALIIVAVAVTYALATASSMNIFNNKVSSITEREKMYSKFTEIDNYVRQYYSVYDEERLMDSVAEGYLSGIDDIYAKYLSAEEYSQYLTALNSTTAGIGVSVSQDTSGYMLVNKVFAGSTAENAGIMKDDLITKIDDVNVTADNFEEAQALLTGAAGTKVTVTFRRDNENTEIEITRRSVTEECISYSKLADYAYIHIDSFYSSAPDQFSKIIDTAITDGNKAIIFDVRNTSEGSFENAASMLDKLLGTCDLLSVRYKNGSEEVIYTSNAKRTEIPMVVIANESTSGPAEFFAGCLRDYGRAKIVGTSTNGFGSYQEMFKLEDGSAIQLTTGKYYLSATGSAWEETGLTPDYLIMSNYTLDFSNVTVEDTEMDAQLAKAIEVVSSSIVM